MRCHGSRVSRNHIVAASIPLNDFPIRVFSNHFARAECIEVASPNLHLRAILASAGEAPFRNTGLRFQIDKMLSIPVMDVGQSFKTWSQPLPDIVLTLKARAIRFTPLGISNTQSSAKNPRTRSRSCALNASHISTSLARIFICTSPDNRVHLRRRKLTPQNYSQSRPSRRRL